MNYKAKEIKIGDRFKFNHGDQTFKVIDIKKYGWITLYDEKNECEWSPRQGLSNMTKIIRAQ